MKRHVYILFFLTLLKTDLLFGQTKYQIDSFLTALYNTKNSRELTNKQEAKQIINYGDKVLPMLANHFTNTFPTKIKSECKNLFLTRGEVSIILADRIEYMPYAKLTNIQNCLLEFCKDNPNLIEYYLLTIRDNVKEFQKRYNDWLTNKDRKKWGPYLANRKNKTNQPD